MKPQVYSLGLQKFKVVYSGLRSLDFFFIFFLLSPFVPNFALSIDH